MVITSPPYTLDGLIKSLQTIVDMLLDAIVRSLMNPAIFLPLFFVTVSTVYTSLTARAPLPTCIPWIGKDSNRLFAETRAHLSSFTQVKQWLQEGYEKYSKRGEIYVLPDFSGKPEVIIPSSEIKWLLAQPDDVLSTSELHYDTLVGPYAFTHPKILKEPFHEHVVHRNMGKRVGELVMDLWDEVGSALDETWGQDSQEWKEICVFENMMHIIARASNRVFIGLPLCRNRAYLKSMESFASDVSMSIIFMRFVPRVLEPIIGRLLGVPNNYHYRQSATLHLPFVKQRLADMARKDSDPYFEWDEPNDYLSWHVRLAQKEGNQAELEPEMISRRLMPINFGAIHTTVFTITNCLFDLLSLSSSPMEAIRAESIAQYQACNGEWTKTSVTHLVHADSAIRESMRVSGFLTRGLQRKVVAKAGLEHKGLGWKLPFGSTVSVDAYGIMHDNNNFKHAEFFDPFRFARPRTVEQEAAASGTSDMKLQKCVESELLSCNTTTEDFLTFGHGRHACPGRFLVSHELKLLLAYASMFYEIEALDTRPPNSWFGQHVIPPMKATIRVRRRKAEDLAL